MSPPFLVVVAGPNGSGKTTLTDALRERGVDLGLYINADEIALTLGPPSEGSAAAAQKRADALRESGLAAGLDMTFETVLSHPSKVDFMTRARARGYRVRLLFVATEDPRANYARVRARVRLGGHDVPEAKVHARYHRTLGLLRAAVLASDEGAVFDNTAPARIADAAVRPLQMVVSYTHRDGVLACRRRVARLPDWVERHFPFPG